MTQTQPKPQIMRDAFQYTPGDGRRYRWTKGQQWITVERFTYRNGRLYFVETGDRIDPPDRNTAAALMEVVDLWREGL